MKSNWFSIGAKCMLAFIIVVFVIFMSIIVTLGVSKASSFDSDNDLHCLAEVVYFEARGEEFIGQLAVAVVVMNRVKNDEYPDNVCDVAHQGLYHKNGVPIRHKCSFSYWCDGKKEIITDIDAWLRAIAVTQMVLSGITLESVSDATHYHANYVKPFWSKDAELVDQIGRHKFYSRRK